jgi:hypothetical protein
VINDKIEKVDSFNYFVWAIFHLQMKNVKIKLDKYINISTQQPSLVGEVSDNFFWIEGATQSA